MKSFRRHTASVNAGSTADIAFLLIMFFLVTTTISADKGILRQLPSICEAEDCTKNIPERNLLRIIINREQVIMVQNDIVSIEEIEKRVKVFVENNGSSKCDYCEGMQSQAASDHPQKALISLSHDALTQYAAFVSVQDEITKAYYKLRAKYAKQVFNKTPEQLSKVEMEAVKKAYPFMVSEIIVKSSN